MTVDRAVGPRPRVLLLVPDASLRRVLDAWLSEDDFTVAAHESGVGDAVELAAKHQPDAVILHIAEEEELATVAQLKERYGLPILVMTHDSSDAVRAAALERGADDFLLIPADWDELVSRLRFLLGRPEERVGGLLLLRFRGGKIEIDRGSRMVKRNGKDVLLTQTEWGLLHVLADPPGEPRFDGELFAKVFSPLFTPDSENLRLWIKRLGEKLGDDPQNPRLIRRYHGAAWLLAVDEAAEETAAG